MKTTDKRTKAQLTKALDASNAAYRGLQLDAVETDQLIIDQEEQIEKQAQEIEDWEKETREQETQIEKQAEEQARQLEECRIRGERFFQRSAQHATDATRAKTLLNVEKEKTAALMRARSNGSATIKDMRRQIDGMTADAEIEAEANAAKCQRVIEEAEAETDRLLNIILDEREEKGKEIEAFKTTINLLTESRRYWVGMAEMREEQIEIKQRQIEIQTGMIKGQKDDTARVESLIRQLQTEKETSAEYQNDLEEAEEQRDEAHATLTEIRYKLRTLSETAYSD